jgi:hypothetical protein
VVGNKDPEFKAIPGRFRNGQFLVDFVRLLPQSRWEIEGIC